MGLFSRRKRDAADDVPVAKDASATGPGTDDAGADADPASADTGAPEASGPYDVADAPDEERIDIGGLRIPMVDGMELRLEMDQRSRTVTGANLVIDGSSLQVQAFAAPKSRSLWDEVRASLRESVSSQGGTAESREGRFGPELVCRLPVKRTDGRTGYRPARFIGIDGPRWFLRAILSGPAVGDEDATARFEEILARIVVVRGDEAMAPQELIPLALPGQRPGLIPSGDNPLDPLARGPEITEIG